MTRKFLLCFPLRVGNIVFGYMLIIISLAVMAYNLYCLGLTVVPQSDDTSGNQTTTTPHEGKFRNWEHLEQLFGKGQESLEAAVTMIYYLSYIVISFFLFLFTCLFLCGAYKANHCLVSTFFAYSFVHLFLSLVLLVLEATSRGYLQLGLLLASDGKRELGLYVSLCVGG
ncbi:unnamed protein product [Plutella xylostella]|uniref:(diamondback moth) hypothetical protein n=1 Tax=Plutella xylostella TaxID=51655 RepID=A0A8S4F907_PLUXY|nr:unnamed protein product [Plutella xylostella]